MENNGFENSRGLVNAAGQKIAVLTDSCTDVPADIVEKYGIRVVPLHINYKNASYRDRVDIQPDEVYARFQEEIPKTSTPTPAEVSAELDAVAADGYTHVVIVAISSGLSGTYNLMRTLVAERTDLVVDVVDTKNIGLGAGLSVIAAAELVAAGRTFEDVMERMQRVVEQTKVLFCVDTLDYLYAGGRIGRVAYSLGSKLDIRPVITCSDDDGVYVTIAKSHGRKGSLKKTLSVAMKRLEGAKERRAVVVHGGAEAEALALAEKFKQEMPDLKEIIFEQISPALVVHTGPGLIGIGTQVMDGLFD